MAGYGVAASARSNVLVSGFTSMVLDNAVGPFTDTLTKIRDGKLKVETLAAKDSKQRERPYGFKAEASCKFMATGKANMQQCFTTWGTYDSNVNINMINGDNFVFGSTGAGAGTPKCKLVIDGDADTDRYIEIMIKRHALFSTSGYDSDTGFGTFTSSTGSGVLDDTLAILPAGFNYVGIRNTGETNYESLGIIRKAKLIAELLTVEDSEKRYVPIGIKVDVEVEALETSATTLAVLDTVGQVATNDFKLTTLDGLDFTLTDNLGIMWSYEHNNDADDAAFIKWSGSGIVKVSDWASILA